MPSTQSVRLYRGAFRSFVLITALALLPNTLLALAVLAAAAAHGGPASPPPAAGLFDGLSPLLALAGRATLGGRRASGLEQFVSFLVTPLLHGALIAATARRLAGAPVSVRAAYRLALRRSWALIGTHLLTTVLVLLPLVPLLLCVMGFFMQMNEQQWGSGPGGGGAGMGAGALGVVLVLIMLPVVLVGTRLALSSQALLLEATGPWASVTRSWRLTGLAFWSTLGYLVIVGLLGGIVGAVIPLTLTVPVGVLFADLPWLLHISEVVAPALASLVVTPFSSIAATVLYAELRAGSAPGALGSGGAHRAVAGRREAPGTVE